MKRVPPDLNQDLNTGAVAVKNLHSHGICTWTREKDRWVVTGPLELMTRQEVLVQAKGREAKTVPICNVRVSSMGFIIADVDRPTVQFEVPLEGDVPSSIEEWPEGVRNVNVTAGENWAVKD